MVTTVGKDVPTRSANGVLLVTAPQSAGNPSKTSTNKPSNPKLKVVVRRLAPGLTEAEFIMLLGEDWKFGQGRVDWFSYKPGKDSKDLTKPSRPSRAYLHLTSESHLLSLSEAIRQTSFEDAQNTWNNPSLLGPPTVEFAPYGRIPSGRRRTDARQGTIDQDPEFMDFLESLANPVSTREPTGDGDVEGAAIKGEKITTTPLVQFLKDKKANKGKESAATKAAKQVKQDGTKTTVSSTKESSASTEDVKKSSKEHKKERLVEKAAREVVKVLNREAAKTTTPALEVPKNPRAQARERGSIAAAARILQRDLGLTPGNAHRKAKADAGNAAKSSETSQSAAPTSSKGAQSSVNKARAARSGENEKPSTTKDASAPSSPIVLLKKPLQTASPPVAPVRPVTPTPPPTAPTAPAQMSAKSTNTPTRKAQQVVIPSSGATRAFVKHANPSQGVTESLLKEAMEAFGAVSHVEIDKRKGFAYVDFVEPEGLVKAIAANPTKIAQGTVQVLERKDARSKEPPMGSARGGFAARGRGAIGRRGRGGIGRGGGEGALSNVPTGPAASATSGHASAPNASTSGK